MLKAGLQRVAQMHLSPFWWSALLMPEIAGAVLDHIYGDSDQMGWFIRIVIVALVVITLIAQFVATRSLGHALPSEEGSFWKWFGWGIVVYLPAAAVASATAAVAAQVDGPSSISDVIPIWIGTVIVALSLILLAPIFVHATGRAVDGDRHVFKRSLDLCKPRYFVIGSSIATAFAIPNLAGDAVAAIGETLAASSLTIAASILSSLLYLFGFLWSTAIAAICWRAIRND